MFEKRLVHENSGEMIPENRLLEDENSGYAIVPRLSKYINKPILFIWLQPQPMLVMQAEFNLCVKSEKSMRSL